MKLRAKEYDKVDVLKLNATLEGRVKNLQIDVENLICERNSLQDLNKALTEQNSDVGRQAKKAEEELG